MMKHTISQLVLFACALAGGGSNFAIAEPLRRTVKLRFEINDSQGRPLPCRIHLTDQKGKPQRALGQPFWRDHFVCSGRVDVDVQPGTFHYAIERGPEYERLSGKLVIASDQKRKLTLRRISHLRGEGWYSGDLHVHRPISEVKQLMSAEDLDFAPVITWWNSKRGWDKRKIPSQLYPRFDGHRLYDVMAGEDERQGGALLYFGLDRPLPIAGSQREVPSPMKFVQQAYKRNPNVWIDIEKPFWWDVPVWLASGRMNSIGLANNHMCRSRMYESEAWGKPRDVGKLPNPRGNGFWSQQIYYHMLNSGLRLPPSAGSASGVLPNPVGYNRVYVHVKKPFTRQSWFQGLAQGRCFVTNGPLLIVQANGKLPGATFRGAAGKNVKVSLTIRLTSNDPISRVEVIQNGKVVKSIKSSDRTTQKLSTEFHVEQTGWFLVRAITDVKQTFRFASTAPCFVEVGSVKRRISRKSVRFFLDWVDERIKQITASVKDDAQRASVLKYHHSAREYWKRLLQTANAE